MKKLIMIVGMAIASIGFSFAQQGTNQQEDRTQQSQIDQETHTVREFKNNEKDGIDKEELPAIVHQNLNIGEYSDWEVEKVYRIDDEARMETGVAYEVRVERGGEKVYLHYDELGNFIPSHEDDGRYDDEDDELERD